MAGVRRGLVVLLILAGALAWAGCSTVAGSSTDDSEIISALHLKKSDGGYEINGEPFCRMALIRNAPTPPCGKKNCTSCASALCTA